MAVGMPPVEWETSLLTFSFKFCASALDELCGYFALIPLQGEFGYYQFPMLCSILTNTLSSAGLFPCGHDNNGGDGNDTLIPTLKSNFQVCKEWQRV